MNHFHEENLFDKEKKHALTSIGKRIKRIINSIAIAEKHYAESDHLSEEYEQKGNLLKCYFQKLKTGLEEVVVEDFYHDETLLTIKLDKKKNPEANVALYFTLAKKLKKNKIHFPDVMKKRQKLLDFWIAVQRDVEKTDNWQELQLVLEKTALLQKTKKEASVKQKQEEGYYHFYSAAGTTLLVGKDAAGNELLTFRIAKGKDLWLHAHGCSGSHVIIKRNDSQMPDADTINDVVQLALYFSKRRAEIHKEHEVVMVECKYVKKVKGHKKGQVTIANPKVMVAQINIKNVEKIKNRVK